MLYLIKRQTIRQRHFGIFAVDKSERRRRRSEQLFDPEQHPTEQHECHRQHPTKQCSEIARLRLQPLRSGALQCQGRNGRLRHKHQTHVSTKRRRRYFVDAECQQCHASQSTDWQQCRANHWQGLTAEQVRWLLSIHAALAVQAECALGHSGLGEPDQVQVSVGRLAASPKALPLESHHYYTLHKNLAHTNDKCPGHSTRVEVCLIIFKITQQKKKRIF